jgi:DNA-binding transcriptional ArsR family regulator
MNNAQIINIPGRRKLTQKRDSKPDKNIQGPYWPTTLTGWSLGDLDDFGLTPPEFRLLIHIFRRAESWACYSGLKDMARVTGISQRMIRYHLRVLVEARLISKSPPGKGRKTNTYRLRPRQDWVDKSQLPVIRASISK